MGTIYYIVTKYLIVKKAIFKKIEELDFRLKRKKKEIIRHLNRLIYKFKNTFILTLEDFDREKKRCQ